ncbi:MAG TPA: FecR domain-containing protein [Methylophilaceae bacterium]|nr:FecR domain-containing protein [Methylophilaceae bacterium]
MSSPAFTNLPAPDEVAADPAQAAAEWLVCLSTDNIAPDERAFLKARFDAWKQADPRHAEAADRIGNFIGQVSRVRSAASSTAPAHAALNAALCNTAEKNRKRARSRRLGAALALAVALLVPAWIGLQIYSPAYLMADIRSATGQWETRTLEDGSRITLGSGGAVNLNFDGSRRTLELVRGEILVDVAHDQTRPFLVETTHGSMRALGTRFVVSRDEAFTVLTMLESKVAVQTASQLADKHSAVTEIHAGQRVRIMPNKLGRVETVDARSVSDAWKYHQLVVQDQPLPDVLDALDRHRPGYIRYDRIHIESIKVSAVLPLDDTDQALQLLTDSFPAVRVRTLTPYLVMVDVPGEDR